MSDTLKKSEKPLVVLIVGGTTTVARTLARYLLDKEEKRVEFVRIADRFSVRPPTTYLEKSFITLLENSETLLEYKQVNLANVDKHLEVYTPPKEWNGKETGWTGFDVVYDLTGDMSFDKPELFQLSQTYQLALSLATSASTLPGALKPGAYVRLTFPFYEMKSLGSSSAGHSEIAELRPDGVRGRWWHEVLRGLARVQGLNTGVVRCGAWYGPGTWEGQVVPRLVVGHVYKYLKEQMKFLYNSDLRINTVHSIDIAQSLYLLSLYLLSHPRDVILSQTAVEIPFTFTPHPTSTFSLGSSNPKRLSMSDTWKTVKTVVPEREKVMIPLFNVVDEGDSTQDKLAKAVAQVWGVQYGFLNSTVASLVQQFAKTDFSEMVEDVNEMHVEAWSKMLAETKPPIESTPISPFLDEHAFRKLAICLDGSKAKRILGYKPLVPRVEVDELKSIVKGFQDDGLWPTLS